MTTKSTKAIFTKTKKLFNIENIDINIILVSKKEPYGKKGPFKYYIGYNDDGIKPVCISLPHMVGYVKHFDSNKTMSFKVNDEKLLKSMLKHGEKLVI